MHSPRPRVFEIAESALFAGLEILQAMLYMILKAYRSSLLLTLGNQEVDG
jgi:hypothetical protein